jgi:hypothetical protein
MDFSHLLAEYSATISGPAIPGESLTVVSQSKRTAQPPTMRALSEALRA